jgi:alkaline phosphatase
VQRFAEQDGETLVLVLADHECSGYSIIGALAGGVTALRALPAENTLLDPAIAPEHQKAVGTYETAKFPSYKILPDGFPETWTSTASC